MKREDVFALARELFKIRVSAARGGPVENDGVHKARIDQTPFYDDKMMIQWYAEAIRTARNILTFEDHYMMREMKNENYSVS